MAQGSHQQRSVLHAVALAHQVAQVWAMEAGNVLIGIAQFELSKNVMTHVPRRARRKRRNGTIRELSA